MAPDDARKEDVRAWLRKAALDLRAGEHAMSDPQAGLLSRRCLSCSTGGGEGFQGIPSLA